MRFNHLHPPFNNVKARQAVAHAVSQQDYMRAAYGDPKYWRECYAFWVCGSPNGTEVGSEDYRKPDLEKARALLKESGYAGQPVVLIGGSDIPAYQQMSLVTADLFKRIGINVDLQLSDWGTVSARRAKKDPPAQGGWNVFHTCANGAQLASPLTSPSTITTCDGKNFVGWPCDQVEEDMRIAYIREPDPAKQTRAAGADARAALGVAALRAARAVPAAVHLAPERDRRAESEHAGLLEHREGLNAAGNGDRRPGRDARAGALSGIGRGGRAAAGNGAAGERPRSIRSASGSGRIPRAAAGPAWARQRGDAAGANAA